MNYIERRDAIIAKCEAIGLVQNSSDPWRASSEVLDVYIYTDEVQVTVHAGERLEAIERTLEAALDVLREQLIDSRRAIDKAMEAVGHG
jgi:hypothetical protein